MDSSQMGWDNSSLWINLQNGIEESFVLAKNSNLPPEDHILNPNWGDELDMINGLMDDLGAVNQSSLEPLDRLLAGTDDTIYSADLWSNNIVNNIDKKSNNVVVTNREVEHQNLSYDGQSNVKAKTLGKSSNPETPKTNQEGGFRLISENYQRKAKRARTSSSSSSSSSSSNISFQLQPMLADAEAIAHMKEMIYRAAAFRPVNLGAEAAEKPKRKNVRISSDPQTVAARQRRERVSERIRVLQKLVPGGTKMDTASMLEEAASYLKFLRSQVNALEKINHHDHPIFSSSSSSSSSSLPLTNHHSLAIQSFSPFVQNPSHNHHQHLYHVQNQVPFPKPIN